MRAGRSKGAFSFSGPSSKAVFLRGVSHPILSPAQCHHGTRNGFQYKRTQALINYRPTPSSYFARGSGLNHDFHHRHGLHWEGPCAQARPHPYRFVLSMIEHPMAELRCISNQVTMLRRMQRAKKNGRLAMRPPGRQVSVELILVHDQYTLPILTFTDEIIGSYSGNLCVHCEPRSNFARSSGVQPRQVRCLPSDCSRCAR